MSHLHTNNSTHTHTNTWTNKQTWTNTNRNKYTETSVDFYIWCLTLASTLIELKGIITSQWLSPLLKLQLSCFICLLFSHSLVFSTHESEKHGQSTLPTPSQVTTLSVLPTVPITTFVARQFHCWHTKRMGWTNHKFCALLHRCLQILFLVSPLHRLNRLPSPLVVKVAKSDCFYHVIFSPDCLFYLV